jgi:hypothetical protein
MIIISDRIKQMPEVATDRCMVRLVIMDHLDDSVRTKHWQIKTGSLVGLSRDFVVWNHVKGMCGRW